MDDLPIEEPKRLEYRSKYPGVMYAGGHNAHMAMVMGSAKLLKEQAKSLSSTVMIVFQPAEEGWCGSITNNS